MCVCCVQGTAEGQPLLMFLPAKNQIKNAVTINFIAPSLVISHLFASKKQ